MLSKYSEKNLLYTLTVLEAIEKIDIYTENINNSMIFFEIDEQKTYNAVCHLLLAVGEETKKIDEKLKDNFAFVNWEQIAAVRNRIAHDYRGLDYEVVFKIIKLELKLLKEVLIKMLQVIDLDNDIIFKHLESPYYKHLNYLKDTLN